MRVRFPLPANSPMTNRLKLLFDLRHHVEISLVQRFGSDVQIDVHRNTTPSFSQEQYHFLRSHSKRDSGLVMLAPSI